MLSGAAALFFDLQLNVTARPASYRLGPASTPDAKMVPRCMIVGKNSPAPDAGRLPASSRAGARGYNPELWLWMPPAPGVFRNCTRGEKLEVSEPSKSGSSPASQ